MSAYYPGNYWSRPAWRGLGTIGGAENVATWVREQVAFSRLLFWYGGMNGTSPAMPGVSGEMKLMLLKRFPCSI